MACNERMCLSPVNPELEYITVYETRSKLYLVGSFGDQSRYRMLKIDRTNPNELDIIDDKIEYDKTEMRELLTTLRDGNKFYGGLKAAISAFGILGFIRFLEGPYIVLVTKRRRVATIGVHHIYKIDDTMLMSILNPAIKIPSHPDESKYVKTFQCVDLSSNFYFSYSYNLTRTLQYNMISYTRSQAKLESKLQEIVEKEKLLSQCTCVKAKKAEDTPLSTDINPNLESNSDSNIKIINNDDDNDNDNDNNNSNNNNNNNTQTPHSNCNNAINSSNNNKNNRRNGNKNNKYEKGKEEEMQHLYDHEATCIIGITAASLLLEHRHPTSTYCEMFAWNHYLMKDMRGKVHDDWLLPIIHGFLAQANIDIYGRPVYLTLIARRSRHFAGARFLKRGSNEQGKVGNHVESEQIVHDGCTTSHDTGMFTSFTQMRGSIPLFWSQDNKNMQPKPAIELDRVDPFFSAAACHFDYLFRRFGTPCIVFNLVKQKEKKARESILFGEFGRSIDYLNQFLEQKHKIVYIPFDMAHCAKSESEDVIASLDSIVEECLKQTGFFHSGPAKCSGKTIGGGRNYTANAVGRKQEGILRVNCIDCLDRTNAAEFMMGKCVFAHQLFALGIIDKPEVDFFSDAVRILEELYEDHGDTIALQYGGSQLVNTMETYRKENIWTSHSRDILNAIHRYYSNAFTDADKQGAINLFLGKYIPHSNKKPLWEMSTDYFLHYDHPDQVWRLSNRNYRDWWSDFDNIAHGTIYRDSEYNDQYSRDVRDHVSEIEGAASIRKFSHVLHNMTNDIYYTRRYLTMYHEHFAHIMPSTRRYQTRGQLTPSPFVSRILTPIRAGRNNPNELANQGGISTHVKKKNLTDRRADLTTRDKDEEDVLDHRLNIFLNKSSGKDEQGKSKNLVSPITKLILKLQVLRASNTQKKPGAEENFALKDEDTGIHFESEIPVDPDDLILYEKYLYETSMSMTLPEESESEVSLCLSDMEMSSFRSYNTWRSDSESKYEGLEKRGSNLTINTITSDEFLSTTTPPPTILEQENESINCQNEYSYQPSSAFSGNVEFDVDDDYFLPVQDFVRLSTCKESIDLFSDFTSYQSVRLSSVKVGPKIRAKLGLCKEET